MAMVTSLKEKVHPIKRYGNGFYKRAYLLVIWRIEDWGLFSLNKCYLGARRGRFITAKTRQYLIGGR